MSADVDQRLADIEQRQRVQGEVLSALESLGDQVRALADQLAGAEEENGPKPYRPAPTVTWWSISEEERQEAERKIRDFYVNFLGTMYGNLGTVPRCWEQHPLAWTVGDWLCELWSYCYLSPKRTIAILSAQADLTIRIIPAAIDLLKRDAKGCDHQLGASPIRPAVIR